ncbi:MAG: 4Fe-4S dicluster domain-containing protein, partial [Planctomycetota bacterium]
MDWVALTSVLLAVLLAAAVLLRRRAELLAHADSRREVALARARGSDRARLQFPSIDLAKCIGCGACVQACPEDGVLALSHGQAVVVHGARCVGHGRCAEVCPTEAIALTLGDLSQRRDLPAIAADHEAIGAPGLFLAGEIT